MLPAFDLLGSRSDSSWTPSILAGLGEIATAPVGTLRITKGADSLSVYQFNTKTAKHFFCSTCGIYTHHQRRSNPTEYSFNVGCLEGVDPFEVQNVTVYDGVNHPRDTAGGGSALFRRVRQPLA